VRARWTASGPAAEPVAGSSGTPSAGANIRVVQDRPDPAKQLTPSTGRAASTVTRAKAAKSGRSAATVAASGSAT
jgi:hypothetical protein